MFSFKDRLRLFHGWFTSTLFFNEYSLLMSNKTQLNELQTSYNGGLRALIGVPRKASNISLSKIRRDLNIYSIEDTIYQQKLMRAWRLRHSYREEVMSYEGPQTRARANGNISLPNSKGSKKIMPSIAKAFNDLPIRLKNEECKKRAKHEIKKIVKMGIDFQET